MVYKVEPVCSVKQSLIGLHNGVMSLFTLLTQAITPMTSQRFFSSVPDGVFNLRFSFLKLEEFGVREASLIESNKLSTSHWEWTPLHYAA